MAFEVKRVVSQDIPIKLLLYGVPGAGKTTLVATVLDHPELSPALFLDFEGGLLSVAGRHDVDAITIRSLSELEEVYWALHTNDERVAKYRTVIIDSASEIYSKALSEAVEKRIKSKGGTLDFVDRGDYGTAGFQTHRLFRMFRDLPGRNIVATAQARFEFEQNADARVAMPTDVGPAFPAKLSAQMQGIFDFVWYLYTWTVPDTTLDDQGNVVPSGSSTVHRGILTTKTGAYSAKTRGHRFPVALGASVEDPSLPAIYDLLQEVDGRGSSAELAVSGPTAGRPGAGDLNLSAVPQAEYTVEQDFEEIPTFVIEDAIPAGTPITEAVQRILDRTYPDPTAPNLPDTSFESGDRAMPEPVSIYADAGPIEEGETPTPKLPGPFDES